MWRSVSDQSLEGVRGIAVYHAYTVCRKPSNFSFDIVRVRINAIRFILFEPDVRIFEIRIIAWRKRNQNRWHFPTVFRRLYRDMPLIRVAFSENKNFMLTYTVWERGWGAVQEIIKGTATWTEVQDSLSYITFLFSRCLIQGMYLRLKLLSNSKIGSSCRKIWEKPLQRSIVRKVFQNTRLQV